MADQNRIVGYVDCGKDAGGSQVVIYLPAVAQIDVKPVHWTEGEGTFEQVTVTFMRDRELVLGPSHSKAFLIGCGMRSPESKSIIVPDVTKALGVIS